MRESRFSLTAQKVGRVLLYVHHHPELTRVLPPGLGEANKRLMMASGLAKPWMESVYESETWTKFVGWMEEHTVPGQTLEYAVRKAFMDAEARRAIAAGATQVLVLGAGFDTLCLRLSEEHPDVLFLEVDHPATSAMKQEALAKLDVARDNLHLVPADLGEKKLEAVLADHPGWDTSAKSVVIAEAVLMYLPAAAVSELFWALRECTGDGSRVCFTWIARHENGELDLGKTPALMRTSMKLIGEPILWGQQPDHLAPFLHELGWVLDETPETNDLDARFLTPAGLSGQTIGDMERMAAASTL